MFVFVSFNPKAQIENDVYNIFNYFWDLERKSNLKLSKTEDITFIFFIHASASLKITTVNCK